MKRLTTRLPAKRCFCATGLLLGLCALAWPAFAQPRINEFLAANNGGLADGDGEEALALAPVMRRQAAEIVDPDDPATWGRVSRNAACPCNSGRKYKHCHGKMV